MLTGLKKNILIAIMFFNISCVETRNFSLPTAVSVPFEEKEIVISAPEGFCVDQRLASKSVYSTTLFIVNCAKVNSSTGTVMKRRPISALLTATVVDIKNSEVRDIKRLEDLLTKKPGINYLSRTNTNAILKVHRVETQKNFLFFLIEQRPADIDVKQSNYFWRLFFFIDERIISMTASNFSDGPASFKKLRKLIDEFAKNTFAANTS